MSDKPSLDIQPSPNAIILGKPGSDKDTRHRLELYVRWLDHHALNWFTPHLSDYRDYLLHHYRGRDDKPLAPSSVQAHLSTIRGRYTDLLRDNTFRDYLYSLTPDGATPADRKSMVDELVIRLRNALSPDNVPVKIIQQRDRPDSDFVRLTTAQSRALASAPGMESLMGLRDTAMIVLMLGTGIREAELCALNVADLYARLGGELALHVREGKGCIARLIPYGEMQWVMAYVEVWLSAAGIEEGAVFRGFYKGAKRVRPTRITLRAINQILDRYPIMVDGNLTVIRPHSLRRTYARLSYELGTDIMAIKDNLGHASIRTTEHYIGIMDVDRRKTRQLFKPPHSLDRLRSQWSS